MKKQPQSLDEMLAELLKKTPNELPETLESDRMLAENAANSGDLYDPIFYSNEDVAAPFSAAQSATIAQWLAMTVQHEKQTIGEITLIFCSDAYLLGINQTYLQHDYYTDVITFPYHEGRDEPIIGDIYISTDRTADNAAALQVPPIHELCRVVVHGVLHLCGYDDASDDARAAMQQKENFYLARLIL